MDEAKPTSDADATDSEQSADSEQGTAPGRRFNVPLAYLRAFIIVLVVAYHAAMSYNTILPEAPASSLAEHLQTMRVVSPVNDAQRSDLLSLFGAFNDTFMMAMMFLLSGLFVWGSLLRKGKAAYLRDRLIRLGIPLVAMVMVRPLTYYPTYLASGGNGGLSDFWGQWSAIEWRGGPIWFLEVLLLFDILLVLAVALGFDMRALAAKVPSSLPTRPFRTFLLVVLMSAISYIPITALYGDFWWLQVGPAQIQINRLLLYAVYFLIGIWLGAYGIDRSILTPDSSLARRWAMWWVAALVIFFAYIAVAVGSVNGVLIGSFYVVTCAATSFAFIALFLRFARTQRRVWDSLFRNSYGIYIIHYGVVSWLAFALLGAAMPAMVKFLLVFAGALALSWGVTAALRRIPLVARVI